MDARLDPAKYAGLTEGDAHVIRNAGGRASDDAIRSLVISYKLLGTREWFVIHHTDCGMEFFSNELMSDLCGSEPRDGASSARTGSRDVGSGGGVERGQVHRLAHDRRHRGQRRRRRARGSASTRSCPGRIPIYGYLYDVKTGKLIEVAPRRQPAAPEAVAADALVPLSAHEAAEGDAGRSGR